MAREQLKKQDLINKLNAKKNITKFSGWCDWTADQAEAHIKKNVKDLDSTKKVLKEMARMIVSIRDGIL